MSFFQLLNIDAYIQGKTESQTNTGELTEVWSDLVSVKTRFQRNLEPFVTEKGYQVTTMHYKFYFDLGVGITEGHRIHINAETYEVVGVYTDSAGHHKEVFAKKITLD